MRLTPAQEAAYSLDFGVSRADLRREVQVEYDRILAERRSGRPGQAQPDVPEFASAEPGPFLKMFARIMLSLSVLVILGFLAWLAVGPRVNIRTLQSDLARVHLRLGYRLVAERKAGTDCHEQCSITQTWAWALSSPPRTTSAACADVLQALNSAYSKEMVDANSPMPAHIFCDYVADLSTISSPGQGKPSVEAIVQASQTHAHSGFLIELRGYYAPP